MFLTLLLLLIFLLRLILIVVVADAKTISTIMKITEMEVKKTEKKTEKGTLLLQKLLGFKEFLKSVEKDRLKEFLKQDEN